MDNKATNNNKFSNDDLKNMQSWDLDRKIAVSLTRITEFYSKYPDKIYDLLIASFLAITLSTYHRTKFLFKVFNALAFVWYLAFILIPF